jgi:hypothetical protein
MIPDHSDAPEELCLWFVPAAVASPDCDRTGAMINLMIHVSYIGDSLFKKLF